MRPRRRPTGNLGAKSITRLAAAFRHALEYPRRRGRRRTSWRTQSKRSSSRARSRRSSSRTATGPTCPRGRRSGSCRRLGDSATVTADFGGLFRVDPEHFDALGLTVPETARTPPPRARDRSRTGSGTSLRTCYDPEIPVNIVELGLVYDCRLAEPGRRRPAATFRSR